MTVYEQPGPLVEVEWIDTSSHHGWQSRQAMRESLDGVATGLHHNFTAGYLWVEAETYIAIVTSWAVGLDNLDYTMQFPRQVVLAIRPLSRGGEDATEQEPGQEHQRNGQTTSIMASQTASGSGTQHGT